MAARENSFEQKGRDMAPETEFVGMAAGTLTTLCWAPQALRILRTRDVQAISLITQILFIIGCCFWLTYGVLLGSLSIMLFNTITIALNLFILALKLRYGHADATADFTP